VFELIKKKPKLLLMLKFTITIPSQAFTELAFLDAYGAQQALLRVLGKHFSLELIETELEAKHSDSDEETPDEDKGRIKLSELFRFVNHMREKASDMLSEEEQERADNV
jgi:hypothetical protein